MVNSLLDSCLEDLRWTYDVYYALLVSHIQPMDTSKILTELY
uniref:Uncharacterized protein n=1 Tax=Rhizophora mucronata TaxID=61149 RepID=A0A2P2PU66_RHIMU